MWARMAPGGAHGGGRKNKKKEGGATVSLSLSLTRTTGLECVARDFTLSASVLDVRTQGCVRSLSFGVSLALKRGLWFFLGGGGAMGARQNCGVRFLVGGS